MRTLVATAILSALLVPGGAAAQHGGASAAQPVAVVTMKEANDPYRPYAFLVGEWLSREGSSTLRQRIGWGPGRAYMTYATYLQQPGRPEQLHFDGIMAWNGKTKNLDFLFGVEPGSWILERGSLHAEQDGSIVRDVELINPNGTTALFRQTIRRVDDNNAVTSLMTRKGDRWEPNFPGSDRIEMKRAARTAAN